MHLGRLIRSILLKPSPAFGLARDWNGHSASASMDAPDPTLATKREVLPKFCRTSANGLGLDVNDADMIATQFVHWLRQRSPTGIWVSHELSDLAWHDFSKEAGVAVPHPRTLMSAIKRGHHMCYRANCRIYLWDGEFARKATLYGFQPLPGRVSVAELSDTSLGFSNQHMDDP